MEKCLTNTYGEQWRQVLRLPNGSYSPRVVCDDAERDFWKTYLTQKSYYQPDEYADKVADGVCRLIRDLGAQSILEIGPGWGNYTLRLAAICHHYTCIDISENVLEYIQKLASDNNASNITTLLGKWEDCLPPRCDVVFAYNCFYRMTEIELCLEKINECAQKLCIIGMNSSPEQPYFHDLEQELGIPVRFTRVDCKDLALVLGSLGIHAEFVSISHEREYAHNSMKEVVDRAVSRIEGAYDAQAVREILERHYRYENGKYRCRHKFCSEYIYWYK